MSGIRIDMVRLLRQPMDFVDVHAVGIFSTGKLPKPLSGDSEFWVVFGEGAVSVDFTIAGWEQFKSFVDESVAGMVDARDEAAAAHAARVTARETSALELLRRKLESQT